MRISIKKLEANRKNAKLAGRPVGSIEDTTAYKKAFVRYVLDCVIKNEEAIVNAMVKKAIEGDVTAFVALRDTAVGKPAQAVEMSGKDGNPIVFLPLELIQKHALQVAESVAQDEEKAHAIEGQVVDNGPV